MMRVFGLMLATAVLLLTSCAQEVREPDRSSKGNPGFTEDLLDGWEEPLPMQARLGPGPRLQLPPAELPHLLAFSTSDPLRALEARLDDLARFEPSTDVLHALGVVRTLRQSFPQAVNTFEHALASGVPSAGLRSDYVAALLERGQAEQRPLDFLIALYEVLEVLHLNPDSPEARFNLALTLDHLGLRHLAIEAWNRYLDMEPSSDWASTARERIALMQGSLEEPEWDELRAEVADDIGANRLEAAMGRLRPWSYLARQQVAETVLGDWAEAYLRGLDGTAALHADLASLAAVLSWERDSDRLLNDSLAAIARAGRSGDRALAALAEAHRDLASGISLRRRGKYERATTTLERAVGRLSAADDPLAGLARLHLAICVSKDNTSAATVALRELARDLEIAPYPWLRAQVEWMLGLTASRAGEPWLSISHYETALELFRESNDPTNEANIGSLLADVYRTLGQRDLSWSSLLATIAALGQRGDSTGLDRALDLAVLSAADDGRLEAALLFQEEQRAHQHWVENTASSRITFFTLRAGLLRKVGRLDEAETTLQEARDRCSTLSDATSRRVLMMEIQAEEALQQSATDPIRSVRRLDAALEEFEAAGLFSRHPELLLARAEAYEGLGDLESAERDLLAGLDLADRLREADQAEIRLAAFETRQALFDRTVRFFLDSLGDPIRALEIAERARARELRSRAGKSEGSRSVAQWQAELPRGSVVLVYAVLPDRLEIWAVSKGSVGHQTAQISARELESQTAALLDSLEAAADSRSSALLIRLYDALIRPVREEIEIRGAVFVVPDRFLTRVPFGALIDRTTGEPVLDRHVVYKTPSVHLLVGSHGRPASRETPRMLAVGDPAFDFRRHPRLAPLPGAADEAREVAALYPFQTVLIGSDATPSRFVEELADSQVLQLAAHTRPTGSHETEVVLAADPEYGSSGTVDLDELDPGALEGLTLAYLSACSAATAPTGDREGLHGPTRALLAAGVPAVVASLWAVEDQASRQLALAFHQRFLRGDDPGAALRSAQLELRAAGAPIHHWAAYEVFLAAWPPDNGGE